MRNIEIKCRVEDLVAVRGRAERLGVRDAGVLEQRDTFFAAPDARLKLRDFGDGSGELIVYRRPDTSGARGSDYLIYRTPQPEALAQVLAHALGCAGVVAKRRHLFLFRNTRIHLDEVEGLGAFVELETVLSGQPEAEAHSELAHVAEALGLRDEDHVAQAYVDLLIGPDGERA